MPAQPAELWDKSAHKAHRQHLISLLDIDGLWKETSYKIITAYQDKIDQDNGGTDKPSIYLQSFSQFLGTEEKFWRRLIVHLHKVFALDEATATLTTLRILPSNHDDTAPKSEQRLAALNFPQLHELPQSVPSDRKYRLQMIIKALLYRGDIMRYKELYSQSKGRPRAGEEYHGKNPTPPRNRPRDYRDVLEIYRQTRALAPNEGQPYCHLAVIASRRRQLLDALTYFYRALCAEEPYKPTGECMDAMLVKALEQPKIPEQPVSSGDLPVPARIEIFSNRTVLYYAYCQIFVDRVPDTRLERDAKALYEGLQGHQKVLYEEFKDLVFRKLLPRSMISGMVVISQAALWTYRLTDHTSLQPTPTEYRLLTNLLTIHQILLQIALERLEQMSKNDGSIVEILPALRIASKWLRANLHYVKQVQGSDVGAAFWSDFGQFTCSLGRKFPTTTLLALNKVLDEDADMQGFLPLEGLMKGDPGMLPAGGSKGPQQDDEMFMRLSDLLEDARLLAQYPDSPLFVTSQGWVVCRGIEAVRPTLMTAALIENFNPPLDDNNITVDISSDHFNGSQHKSNAPTAPPSPTVPRRVHRPSPALPTIVHPIRRLPPPQSDEASYYRHIFSESPNSTARTSPPSRYPVYGNYQHPLSTHAAASTSWHPYRQPSRYSTPPAQGHHQVASAS